MENGIVIGGDEFELTENKTDDGACSSCDLRELCDLYEERGFCGKIFKASNKNFKLKNSGMESRQLRIGDKVEYLGKIVTIRAIYDTGHVEFLMRDGTTGPLFELTINVKNIEPIPLTDELLCKIGIIPYMRANTSTYYAIKDYCQLDYISNMGYYTFTAEAGKQHIRTSKHIYYLHQLQHEMFDAGIEFKIEL